MRLPPTLLSYAIRQALNPDMPADEAFIFWHYADLDMMAFLARMRFRSAP